jgi:hypothetical protein
MAGQPFTIREQENVGIGLRLTSRLGTKTSDPKYAQPK